MSTDGTRIGPTGGVSAQIEGVSAKRIGLSTAHGYLLAALLFLQARCAVAQDALPKFEAGPQITQLYVPKNIVGSVTYQPSLGGIFCIAIKRNLAFDSAVSFTPNVPNESTSFAGGRMTQAFLGARMGFVRGRIGIYAKIRPGVVSFGGAILRVTPSPTFGFQLGRLTEPSLDAGGIVTVAVSRRLAVRYEAGDTVIFYGSRVLIAGAAPIPGRATNNFQFGIAFLFRF